MTNPSLIAGLTLWRDQLRQSLKNRPANWPSAPHIQAKIDMLDETIKELKRL